MASGTADTGPGTAADRCNARIYLIGLATSMLGDSAMGLVAGIWVKSLTGSSSVAGLVSACVYLPSLFGPVGGVIADRVHRQRLLIQLNLASALILLALLAVRSAAEVWIIFVVMTWYGIVLMVSGPAENALFAEMLPRAPEPHAESRWRADLLAGFAHVRQTPLLRQVLLAGAIVMAVSATAVA